MKIIFSSIKNNDIFETDFAHLSSQNGTIEFKHMQGSGGIAVIYAPNGTGKTSLANLLDVEVSTEKNSFVASDDQGNTITPETMAYLTGELNVSVLCPSTRMLCKWSENDMAVGIPFELFEAVTKGIIATQPNY